MILPSANPLTINVNKRTLSLSLGNRRERNSPTLFVGHFQRQRFVDLWSGEIHWRRLASWRSGSRRNTSTKEDCLASWSINSCSHYLPPVIANATFPVNKIKSSNKETSFLRHCSTSTGIIQLFTLAGDRTGENRISTRPR